jgi:hypothetical protein
MRPYFNEIPFAIEFARRFVLLRWMSVVADEALETRSRLATPKETWV